MIRIIKESWSFLSSEDMKNYRGAIITLKSLGKLKNCGLKLYFYQIRFRETPLKGKSQGVEGGISERGMKGSLGRVVPPRSSI